MTRLKFFLSRFLFCFFLFVSVVGYSQIYPTKCPPKFNNNERKIFKKLPPVKEADIDGLTKVKGVSIQYLGAGGVLITKGETTIAIDPFFSNKALNYKNWIEPWKRNLNLRPDTALINRLSEIQNLRNASAVFVTHAHYDHLLDVPYLYKKVFNKQPQVYGNTSVNHLLKNLVPSTNLNDVQNIASQYSKTEIHWINIGEHFRVMPIISDHAPHYKFVKFFDGETIDSPTEEQYYTGTPPTIWKEGRTMAYLVEVMEGNDTLRIHIQTSACTPNDGLPPASYIKAIGRVDISMFCMASFDLVSDYPNRLITELNPQKIIIVHWENFFKKYKADRKKYKVVPFTNGLCFLEQLEGIIAPATIGEKCLLPLPGAFIKINY